MRKKKIRILKMRSSEYLIKFSSLEEKNEIIDLIEKNNMNFMHVLEILERYQNFSWVDYDSELDLEYGLTAVADGIYVNELKGILFKNMYKMYIKVKHCTVVVIHDAYAEFEDGTNCVRLFFDHDDIEIDMFLSNNSLEFSFNDRSNYETLEVIISEKGKEEVIDLGEISSFEDIEDYGMESNEHDERDYEDRI